MMASIKEKEKIWNENIQKFEKSGGSQAPNRRELFSCIRCIHARVALVAGLYPENEYMIDLMDDIETDMSRLHIGHTTWFDD